MADWQARSKLRTLQTRANDLEQDLQKAHDLIELLHQWRTELQEVVARIEGDIQLIKTRLPR